MSQVLTVPTHFNDIGELSEGFLDRIEQDTLILYGPVAYEDGSEIEFAVLLADGTPALEGVGRVRAAVDGGEERVPETRYDVVVEALELDGRSDVVFERLVIAREAVSERPVADDEGSTDETSASSEMQADEEVKMSIGPVESLGPDAYEDDDYDEEDPPTVLAEIDPEMLAMEQAASEPEVGLEPEMEHAAEIANVIANANATEIAIEAGREADDESVSAEAASHHDSMYAFEHGIAAEPRVGMPVPVPSMAAPPEAPPAPPSLRLAEPPEGLTRPSFAEPEDALFSVDDEVSDVHTTGLFAYENGLPIPSRPPLPDPNRAKKVPSVEAANDYDVEDSEPPELLTEGYEEVRLSDFAEAADEG